MRDDVGNTKECGAGVGAEVEDRGSGDSYSGSDGGGVLEGEGALDEESLLGAFRAGVMVDLENVVPGERGRTAECHSKTSPGHCRQTTLTSQNIRRTKQGRCSMFKSLYTTTINHNC